MAAAELSNAIAVPFRLCVLQLDAEIDCAIDVCRVGTNELVDQPRRWRWFTQCSHRSGHGRVEPAHCRRPLLDELGERTPVQRLGDRQDLGILRVAPRASHGGADTAV